MTGDLRNFCLILAGMAMAFGICLGSAYAAEPEWRLIRYSTATPDSENGSMTFRLSDNPIRWHGELTIGDDVSMPALPCREIYYDADYVTDRLDYFRKQTGIDHDEDYRDSLWEDVAKNQDMTCIMAAGFVFAFPLVDALSGRHWSALAPPSGLLPFAKVEEDLVVAMFGKRIAGVMRIEGPMLPTMRGRLSDERYEYLYSPKVGVLAFTKIHALTGAPLSDTYWLEGEIGIGAIAPD